MKNLQETSTQRKLEQMTEVTDHGASEDAFSIASTLQVLQVIQQLREEQRRTRIYGDVVTAGRRDS